MVSDIVKGIGIPSSDSSCENLCFLCMSVMCKMPRQITLSSLDWQPFCTKTIHNSKSAVESAVSYG